MSREALAAPPAIAVQGVTKRYGAFAALDDLTLEVPTGELVALLGPSGSGKTTLLRVIAGLEAPDAGHILFHGEDATARHARERRVGFVFQHYALFRHMTVFENVAFGLRVQPRGVRPSGDAIRARVQELLDLVQLGPLGTRYPDQLSGGQRQRVGLARALAVRPKVLLLDEPFGALDAKVRKELRRWLRRLHDEIQVTSVFVTHDQDEALEVADRVVVMHQGRIEQVGTPEDVYDRPATPFVYSFLGSVNLFHGRLEGGRLRFGAATANGNGAGHGRAGAVAFVRTHEVDIERAGGDGAFAATVSYVRALGATVRLELESASHGEIEAEMPRTRYDELRLSRGDQVFVRPRQVRVFGAEEAQGVAPDLEWVL
jgi:sulfate transport system ATP-binding protein